MRCWGVLAVWLVLSGCPWPPPWVSKKPDGGGPQPAKADRSDGGAPRHDPDAGSVDAAGVDASVTCTQGPQKFRASPRYGVVNGTREPQYVPLSDSQKLSVLGLAFGGPSGADCSGTLVAERT